jgi:hypothetical protein
MPPEFTEVIWDASSQEIKPGCNVLVSLFFVFVQQCTRPKLPMTLLTLFIDRISIAPAPYVDLDLSFIGTAP